VALNFEMGIESMPVCTMVKNHGQNCAASAPPVSEPGRIAQCGPCGPLTALPNRGIDAMEDLNEVPQVRLSDH
jgi:hypothetical protein